MDVDKKIISAFNDLSRCIEELSEALKNKNKAKSDSGKILQSMNSGKLFTEIKNGLKAIKKDTEEILKNQKLLITSSKSKKDEKHSFFDKVGEKNKKIADGVSAIVLIASGVLAIGLAFKLIGHVDIASVIALSISIPIIAIAFQKIAEMKSLKGSEIKQMMLIVVSMASSVAISSWILSTIIPISIPQTLTAILIASTFAIVSIGLSKLLTNIKAIKISDMIKMPFILATMAFSIAIASHAMSYIQPISIAQGLTAILIAGTFAVVSHGIENIVKGIKNVKLGDVIKMPLVLTAMAVAIAAASAVMQFIMPITINQALTAVFIAATFAVVSFSLAKISKGIEGIKQSDIIVMPLVLTAIAAAIAASSIVMQFIMPITINQALTAILIAATFTIISYGMEPLAKGIAKLNPAKALILPVILVGLAYAIALSSDPLSKTTPIPIGLLFNIALQGITLVVISASLGAAIWTLNKLGVGPKEAVLGGVTIALLAATIAGASRLLGLGQYSVYPPLDWSIGVAASLAAFGLGVFILGELAMEGGAVALAAGGVAIALLAATIAGASQLLGLGQYSVYPPLDWSIGVAASLAAFGLGVFILGELAMGGGAVALAAGGVAIVLLTGIVVGTSRLLGLGEYGTYPSLDWSKSVALSLLAFGAGTLALGVLIAGSLGAGLVILAGGAAGIDIVANSIVSASKILKDGVYTGGPTKEWAEGISLALGAFSPIFKMLYDRGILGIFSKGPSIDDFAGDKGIIIGICKAIVKAGEFFKGKDGLWSGGPTKEWAAGVGGAISAFAPVFETLTKSKNWFGGGGMKLEDITGDDGIIISICKSITKAANYFNDPINGGGDIFKGGPTADWSSGLSSALSAFAPVFDYLSKNSGWFKTPADDLKNAITSIASGIVAVANSFKNATFSNSIPDGYMKSLTDNVKMYVDLISYLRKNDATPLSFISTSGITHGLTKLVKDYDELSKSITALGTSINSLNLEKLEALQTLNSSIVLMSVMDPTQFQTMMDTFESKAGMYVKIMEQMETKAEAKSKSYGTVNTLNSTSNIKESSDDKVLNTLISMDTKLGSLVKYNRNFNDYIDEMRISSNNSIKGRQHIG